jgi:hypothetical protein
MGIASRMRHEKSNRGTTLVEKNLALAKALRALNSQKTRVIAEVDGPWRFENSQISAALFLAPFFLDCIPPPN